MNWFSTPSKSKQKFIASIDQGTSSTRFMVFDKSGNTIAISQKEHKQYYPQQGHVEHDAQEIWMNVKTCVEEALRKANLSSDNIVSLGITNQRETTVIWDKITGLPYTHAIVWNDTRTTAFCESLKSQGLEDKIKEKTGLPLSCYFSASKIKYLIDTHENVREGIQKGNALFGTIDSWLLWKLTKGQCHYTDVTNASRTLLYNIRAMQWDQDLLEIFSVPASILPSVKSSSEVYGTVAANTPSVSTKGVSNNSDIKGLDLGGIGCLEGVPIGGILGDQHAALFGQVCFQRGEMKCTYGTGAFLMMNTGSGSEGLIQTSNGLLTTIAYQLGPDHPPVYALEGSVAYCGSLIQWLREQLQVIPSIKDSEALAATVEDNGGVYFVPAFNGLFAPYWRSDARGCIVGLTAYANKAHVVRAALEAAAYQTNEIVEAMKQATNTGLQSSEPSGLEMKVDGGMTNNNLVMQFQSDLTDTVLVQPTVSETTAQGAAYAGGLAVGYYNDIEEIKENWSKAKSWHPTMEKKERLTRVRGWQKAVARSLAWHEEDDDDDDDDSKDDGTQCSHDSLVRRHNDNLIASLRAPIDSESKMPSMVKSAARPGEHYVISKHLVHAGLFAMVAALVSYCVPSSSWKDLTGK